MEKEFINIRNLIKSKNPRLLKWLPRFVVSYLEKILHQDEVNDFMFRNKDLHNIDFCNKVIEEFHIKVNCFGLENIPKTDGFVFVSNHPLGGMDAMAIVTQVGKIRQDIMFIVNDLLLNLGNLNGLFTGVNKHGKNASSSLQKVDELFASNKAVFVFPAGLVSRKKNKVVQDLEWKKTFVSRAKKHDKTVIPVFVEGNLSNFFYNLSNFRNAIGIKSNIEMLYLADEMYKQKNKTISIYFGKEISITENFKNLNDYEIAQEIKKTSYALAQQFK
jgi:putative hemolysin